MGFKSVYQTLRELFPQVDIRLLKAAAIEHSKDPDVAVEHILTDVLPYIVDNSTVRTSAERDGKSAETSNSSPSMSGSLTGDGNIASSLLNDGLNLDDDSLASPFYDANDTVDQLSGNPQTASPLLNKCDETSYNSVLDERSSMTSGLGESSEDRYGRAFGEVEGVSSVSAQHKETDQHVHMSDSVPSPSVGAEGGEANVILSSVENVQPDCVNASCNLEQDPVFDALTEQPSVTCKSPECGVSTNCAAEDQMPGAFSWNSHPEAENGSNLSCANNEGMSSFLDSEFTLEFPGADAVGAGTQTLMSTIVTRSGQICKVNLLEDIIEEAKNYKDTVCSAMESVVSLMEEVELQENEVEQAKVAATRGGMDILEKVEDIKKMLKHAREANDMHAGEVYGEKSILATEVKELQARLLGLSDEKDKSLSMLDEMRMSLEERLAVAEEQRRTAEQEMLDKQEIARGALAEQELAMDKVVQESKLLQQEADENAKLRDFLMEKGQVVDGLQGEISVICQDVKLLKESFDKRVSLSKSLSFGQTSSRLASSSSSVKSAGSLRSITSLKSSISSLKRTASLKSTASSMSQKSTDSDDQATVLVKSVDSPARMSGSASVECHTPRSEVGEDFTRYEAMSQKPLSDEEWELCDMI